MHLEDEIGAGFDELSLAGLHDAGGHSGSESDQQFRWARIVIVPAAAALFVIFFLHFHEGDARLGILQPFGSGRADKSNDVVHELTVARARLNFLHPLVFGKAGRDDDVLIIDGAGGRNGEFVRHFENDVGFVDAPAIGELHRLGSVGGIALGGAGVGPGDEGVDFCGGEASGRC